MPTVIDSLIVELQLDPSGFTEGQRRATEQLRRLEGRIKSQASATESVAKGSVRQTLGGIDASLRSAANTLSEFGKRGRRTGENVRHGSSVGKAGLKELAEASIRVYASFKSLQGIIGQVTSVADRGAGLGRIAYLTGVSATWLDAFQKTAFELGNVDPGQTMAALQAYQQRLTAYQKGLGEYSQEFTRISALSGKTGVNIDFNAPLATQIEQITEAVKGMSGPEANYWLQGVGLGPLANLLTQGNPAIKKGMGEAGGRSLDSGQVKNLTRLQEAANKAQDSISHLWETIASDFSEAGLVDALNGLSKILDQLSVDKDAMKILETSVVAVSVISTTTMVSAIARLVTALNSIWLTPFMRFFASPFGRWFIGPLAAFFGAAPLSGSSATGGSVGEANRRATEEQNRRDVIEWNRTHPNDQLPVPSLSAPAGGSPSTPMPPISNPSPTASTGNWEVRHNNFAGIRRPGVIAGPNSGGFMEYPSPEAGVQAIGGLQIGRAHV